MERLAYDLLSGWFVGIGVEEAVHDRSTFSKNRDRLFAGDIAVEFLAAALAQPSLHTVVRRSRRTDQPSKSRATPFFITPC